RDRRSCRSAVRQKVLFDVVAVGLEQHVGAAQLADLLLGAFDHAVALVRLRIEDLAGPRHLEALLGAGFGLQLGHLALLGGKAAAAPSRQVGRAEGAAMLVMSGLCVSTSPPPRQPYSAGRREGALWQRPPLKATEGRLSAAPAP